MLLAFRAAGSRLGRWPPPPPPPPPARAKRGCHEPSPARGASKRLFFMARPLAAAEPEHTAASSRKQRSDMHSICIVAAKCRSKFRFSSIYNNSKFTSYQLGTVLPAGATACIMGPCTVSCILRNLIIIFKFKFKIWPCRPQNLAKAVAARAATVASDSSGRSSDCLFTARGTTRLPRKGSAWVLRNPGSEIGSVTGG